VLRQARHLTQDDGGPLAGRELAEHGQSRPHAFTRGDDLGGIAGCRWDL
jgi:hypothetical protein